MSVATVRGGVPAPQRRTISAAGEKVVLPFMALWLQIRTSAEAVKVYFTELDFTRDENYILVPVPSATEPWGWEGPAEIGEFWLKSDSATPAVVEIVGYQRRG